MRGAHIEIYKHFLWTYNNWNWNKKRKRKGIFAQHIIDKIENVAKDGDIERDSRLFLPFLSFTLVHIWWHIIWAGVCECVCWCQVCICIIQLFASDIIVLILYFFYALFVGVCILHISYIIMYIVYRSCKMLTNQN